MGGLARPAGRRPRLGSELSDLTELVVDREPGPEKLRSLTLVGRDVTLRTPVTADGAALFDGSHEQPDLVWAYMGYGPWPDLTSFEEWMTQCARSEDPLWFTVVGEGAPIGMATMMSYERFHRRLELGHIWYVPAAQRTTANTETAYLLLRHAFYDYRARRVEWKCDVRNERSRLAAKRLGFEFEGVFRQHMIVKGRNRDTAWYAMTDASWPAAAARLEEWLYATERDDSGRPVRPLAQIGRGEQTDLR